MKTFLSIFVIGACCQQAAVAQSSKPKKVKKPKVNDGSPYAPGPLFTNVDSLLEFKLTGNLKETFNDRDADEVDEHPMLLTFNSNNKQIALPLKVKARGHFRRMKENCSMPPLWIDFRKEAKLAGTLFEKQNKLKLVTPCRSDEYVVREFLIYKIYELLSPQCMKARLVKVTFEDSMGKVKPQTQFCILIEDDSKAARRNGYFTMEKKMVASESVNAEEFTRLAVFQYLIGNTDWSVPYLHNIRLAFKDSNSIPIAIPYDFDHSGMVSAPYALPPEQLGITSVQERIYRGYCQNMTEFQSTFALFNRMKDKIYQLYTDCPYLNEKYVKFAKRYLDDFYKVINNPKTAEREFRSPCTRKVKISIGGYENQ